MAGKLKIALKAAAACLVLSIVGSLTAVASSADELSDYEKKQKELDSQAQEYQSIIDKTQSDISEKEAYKEALLNKISTLNEQIVTGREQIASLDEQITQMQSEIDTAHESISDRIDTLKQRLKVIYLSGETTSLEIILGAKSFEDFLDKLEIVSYISDSDEKMISQLQGEIQVINKKKEEMAETKTELDEEQAKLDTRQEELEELIEENEGTLDGLYYDNAAAQDHLDENNAERKEIEDAIMAYYADKAAQEEAARIASEAEKKLAESRLAYESAKNNSSADTSTQNESENQSYDDTTTSESETSSYTSYISPSRPASSSSAPSSSKAPPSSKAPSSQAPSSSAVSSEEEVYSSGYVWPVPGHYYLTSQWNEDRGSYNHGAIDISDGSIMNAQVVAAESGTVVLSNDTCTHNYGKDGSCGCGGGYGNYLMIDHGSGKATLYAHLTSLTVSSGTYVQKGQVIGYVGSTGESTGPHLHFETRLNGVKYNPMTEYPNM